jgi:D-cysteine desulfhydrase
VQRLDRLERSLGTDAPALYIKRDDVSGKTYGGNKVRKLEFLLAEALRQGRKQVLTFGAAGSNHALATALYARQLGLGCVSMLVPQPNARSVRRNLLRGCRAGAELHLAPGMFAAACATLWQLGRHGAFERQFPYLIPPGGSSPVGMVGFVNAGLELKAQIDAGQIPEPDYVYAASGTMGTVVGLLLGLKVAGLRSKVIAVRVTAPQFSSMRKARGLFAATNTLLHRADALFPEIDFPESDFEFRHEFYGSLYALYTEAGMQAVRRLHEEEGIKLEGTYTGKTFAAVLADTAAGRLRGKTALFWDTCNSRDFGDDVANLDYHALPKAFHHYFEEEVQPLDR